MLDTIYLYISREKMYAYLYMYEYLYKYIYVYVLICIHKYIFACTHIIMIYSSGFNIPHQLDI